MMGLRGFDHVAIPAGDPEALIAFYRALGFGIAGEEAWRAGDAPVFAITLGDQKINVHDPRLWQNAAFTLRGPTAQPGCGDFCFAWDGTIDEVRDLLARAGAPIIEGPVERAGGRGPGMSLYTRDPDGNLLEFIVYAD
jgi:catechol 2,3-dioxygenase-like lactoylglutathione lyase family enzyme